MVEGAGIEQYPCSINRRDAYAKEADPITAPTINPTLSVVIPAFDEEKTLRPLYERICAALDPLEKPYEIILIDDGSQDGSYEIMRELHESDSRVRVLRFWRNAGKSPALAAGFEAARGEVVFTIDADLQDDPAELPRLMEKLDEGYDLVSGWKKDRKDPWMKLALSWVFNRVVARYSGISLRDFNCGLKAYRREVLKPLFLYGEMHRFIPVLASGYGFRITELPVKHYPRSAGRSKYGIERVWRGLLDFLTVIYFLRFGQRPAHLFGAIGFLLIFAGAITMLASPVAYFWFSGMAAALLFFGGALGAGIGVKMVFLGLLAETLVSAIHRWRPSYYINERLES